MEPIANDIRHLFEKLEIEPRTAQERLIVCENVDKIPILSLDLMDSAQNILQELRREIKSNNQLAKEIVDEIKSISEKLKMPCDLARLQRDFYSSKVIAEVKIRQ